MTFVQPAAANALHAAALETNASLVEEEVDKFLHFTGVEPLKPNSIFILVMGTTGAGKSTFVSQCTGKEVKIGHDLVSCTKDLAIFELPFEDHNVYLIDTPGFDDTDRSDTDTLKLIAHYLSVSYANRVYIGGIVYLHRIADNRVSGTTKRNIAMFKALCGYSTYGNVAIATTMWNPDEFEQNVSRESQLFSRTDFFGDIFADGARHFRHSVAVGNDAAAKVSGLRILSHLMSQSRLSPVVLQIQHEMVDEMKALDETEAGKVLLGDLARARAEHMQQIRQLKEELKQALERGDHENARTLAEMHRVMQQNEAHARSQSEALQKSLYDLHKEEEKRLTRILDELEEHWQMKLEAKERELKKLEKKLQNRRRKAEKPRETIERPQLRSTSWESSETLVEREDQPSQGNDRSMQPGWLAEQHNGESQIYLLQEQIAGLRNEVEGKRKSAKKVRTAIKAGLASGATSGAVAAIIAGGVFCVVC